MKDEPLKRCVGPFPNYDHLIVENGAHHVVNRYMLESRCLTNIYNMPDGTAYTSCPICGASLYPAVDGTFSLYQCKCKTYICEVGPIRYADLIVVRFDVAIAEFELVEDII